jgi:hypothetical protein
MILRDFDSGYYNYLNKQLLQQNHSTSMSATVASIISKGVVLPFTVSQDIINQRILHNSTSFRYEIKQIYKSQGVRGFLKDLILLHVHKFCRLLLGGYHMKWVLNI